MAFEFLHDFVSFSDYQRKPRSLASGPLLGRASLTYWLLWCLRAQIPCKWAPRPFLSYLVFAAMSCIANSHQWVTCRPFRQQSPIWWHHRAISILIHGQSCCFTYLARVCGLIGSLKTLRCRWGAHGVRISHAQVLFIHHMVQDFISDFISVIRCAGDTYQK